MNATDDYFELTDPQAGSSVAFDLRYFPCYVTHWSGAPSLELMNKVISARRDVFQRGQAEGKLMVQITDLTKFSAPSATVRKYMGEVGNKQDLEFADVFAGYVVVVPSAIIRGVITALKWFGGEEVKPALYVSSVESAFSTDWTKSLGVDLRSVNYVPRSA